MDVPLGRVLLSVAFFAVGLLGDELSQALSKLAESGVSSGALINGCLAAVVAWLAAQTLSQHFASSSSSKSDARKTTSVLSARQLMAQHAPGMREACPEKPAMDHKFDYDLIVIGGGSGGLACAKEAAVLGAKVACFDYVTPSPQGTTWGLGGTCVNVGCIPKKIFHTAALIGQDLTDAPRYGWSVGESKEDDSKKAHSWPTLVENTVDFIKGLNWNYRKALKEKSVTYINALATFADDHTIEYVDKKTKEKTTVTARSFCICVGGRPQMPKIPGIELAITSDDIFYRKEEPGSTLVVGASYIALECAGFLHELGYHVEVMQRSIVLRGFDQQMANHVKGNMVLAGLKFIEQSVPKKLEKTADGRIEVTFDRADAPTDGSSTTSQSAIFDTVLFATGRAPETAALNLHKAGVKLSSSRKIVVSAFEQTSASHVYAIGDVAEGRPELTPVAIKAGLLLARRLYGSCVEPMDYINVATTVFTPYEYGCVGLSQEAASEEFGKSNVECYLSKFGTLEHSMAERKDHEQQDFSQGCFAKLVCRRVLQPSGAVDELVVGFHYVGPNAGEVTQGFALAVKAGVTKADFDALVGIHPTAAEEFTTLTVTSSSGDSFEKEGGC